MRYSELANRYAKSLYDISAENKQADRVFAELRAVQDIFQKDVQITEFMNSPVMKAEDKEAALKEAFKNGGLSEETHSLVLLLAKKRRLQIFPEIVEAFQARADEAHGVTRGTVRSAIVLSPEERKRIEATVSNYTKKQVILTYKEDPNVIGGLIAEVGSYTFDDTLKSHLSRLNEELNRRTH